MRFLIVEDDFHYRKYLHKVITGAYAANVLFSQSIEEAERKIFRTKFDLILLDLGLKDSQGLQTITRILDTDTEASIIIITKFLELSLPQQISEIGVGGMLMKDASEKQITKAIDLVLEGLLVISPKFKVNLSEGCQTIKKKTNPYSLTPTEWKVVSALSTGKQYKTIAHEMNSTLSTIQSHIKNIYRKLDATNRTEALNIMADYLQYKEK